MESDKIKLIPKPHLKLRRIGSRHMIVEASDSCVNLTNVYSLNGCLLYTSPSPRD